jgi:hypothetical protein
MLHQMQDGVNAKQQKVSPSCRPGWLCPPASWQKAMQSREHVSRPPVTGSQRHKVGMHPRQLRSRPAAPTPAQSASSLHCLVPVGGQTQWSQSPRSSGAVAATSADGTNASAMRNSTLPNIRRDRDKMKLGCSQSSERTRRKRRTASVTGFSEVGRRGYFGTTLGGDHSSAPWRLPRKASRWSASWRSACRRRLAPRSF